MKEKAGKIKVFPFVYFVSVVFRERIFKENHDRSTLSR